MNAGSNGLAKFAWLITLKNSARSCMFTCSVMAVSLCRAMSHCLNCGPRRALRHKPPKCRVPGTGTQSDAVPEGPPFAEEGQNLRGPDGVVSGARIEEGRIGQMAREHVLRERIEEHAEAAADDGFAIAERHSTTENGSTCVSPFEREDHTQIPRRAAESGKMGMLPGNPAGFQVPRLDHICRVNLEA